MKKIIHINRKKMHFVSFLNGHDYFLMGYIHLWCTAVSQTLELFRMLPPSLSVPRGTCFLSQDCRKPRFAKMWCHWMSVAMFLIATVHYLEWVVHVVSSKYQISLCFPQKLKISCSVPLNSLGHPGIFQSKCSRKKERREIPSMIF